VRVTENVLGANDVDAISVDRHVPQCLAVGGGRWLL